MLLVRCLIVATALLTLESVPGTAARDSGADALAALVQTANNEGRLLATVPTDWNQALLPKLADAFKKRFGLTIEVTVTPVRSATQFPLEIAATKAGAAPTYDVMQGDDAETMQLIGGGGVQPVPNWQALLRAINPAVSTGKVSFTQISRAPFDGSSFEFMGNVKQLLYNPNAIAASALPRTHAELVDAKFTGKFVQPPWTAHWEMAPSAINGTDRDKFVELVRGAGKNTGAVLTEAEGAQRVVLGQYAFVLAQDTYIRAILAKDPKAPIAGVFLRDYNQLNVDYYSVRTRTTHPAAAALWALWMTTAEAETIWQAYFQSYVPYGSSPLDIQERQTIQSQHVPVVGYLDNAATVAYLKWQQTPDGARFLTALAKAIRGE
jgi:ABC-type Fe3+ transport system substrate-binding protein